MITLDASVVIAHLDPRDAHHRHATALIREHIDRQFLIHPLNLAEVLVGGVRDGRGQEMLADLDAIGIRTFHSSEDEPLRLATLRAESGLKLPDCCAVDTALTTRSPLATFDGNLWRAGQQRHLTVLPEVDPSR